MMQNNRNRREPSEPLTGIGLGLRWSFLEDALEGPPLDVAFFEVSPENYMRRGGYIPEQLERVKERYPIVTHGLTMSLGAVDPPADDYLDDLSTEIARVGTPWHSDHLCWSTAGPVVLHDLLPLKLAKTNADRVADRLRRVEDRLGLPMLVENISWYAHPGQPEMPEEDFIVRVLERSGSGLLLDVNNVYVNSKNHGFDPYQFIDRLPLDRVGQIHVAGHEHLEDGMILDTHGAAIIDPVYELLEWTLERTGPMPVLLERDHNIPPLPVLLKEVGQLDAIYRRAVAQHRRSHAKSA
jgi:uncharacterized protein (UPF0276 family)